MLESFTTWFCLKQCVFKLVKPICMFVLPIFGFVIIHYFVWKLRLGLHSHLSIHTHTHLYLSVTFINITLTFTSTLTITSHTHTLSGPSSSQTCYSVFILAPSGLWTSFCASWLLLMEKWSTDRSYIPMRWESTVCVWVSEWLTAWVSD